MMNLRQFTLCGALALGLAGCPGGGEKQPIKLDSSKAALTINDQTDALAESVAQSASFLGQTETMQEMNTVCEPDTINRDGTTNPGKCTSTAVDTAQPERDAAKWLKDHFFNADHIDASQSTDTAVVFCLKTADMCGTTASADCAKVWDAVPVCVKAQSFVENEFELAVLVGKPPQNNPFNLSLKTGYLKAEVKLADVKKSYEAFMSAAGEPMPEGFPTRFEGSFSAELAKVAEKSVNLKAAILEAIAVDLYPAADARHSEFRVAAAPALYDVTLDGDKKVVDAKVDAKAVDLLVAAQNAFGQDAQPCPEPPETCPAPPEPVKGSLLAHLDGSSFKVKFDAANEETVKVDDIGLGDSTSKLQYKDASGAVSDIAKLDLNPSLQRRVSITYVKKADGAQVSFAPGLELLLDHDLRALAAQLPDLKGAALKAVSSVKFTGTNPTLFLRSEPSETKVQSGKLELKATGMIDLPDVAVTIDEGQCVQESASAPPADSHPFAGSVAGTCAP